MIPYPGTPKRKPIPFPGAVQRGGPKGVKHKDNRDLRARIDIMLTAAEKCATVAQAYTLKLSTAEYVRRLIAEDIERRMKASPVPEDFKWPPTR